MKRDIKDFEKYVRDIRRIMRKWRDGRSVVYLSEYSEKGKQILDMASRYEGECLHQIYSKWSPEKQKAYDDAWAMYCNDIHSESWGICSHNSQGFTVSWLSDQGLTYLTYKTEYHVIFNE